ncbi:MAG TPA: hypothetical protein VFS43_34605 [Polyangiaceae bacterium]|nr:hypothetical protein [Polyangiaceae bacterium]
MYITAQRVRSSSLAARQGVNAFLNLHDKAEARAENWDNPSIERLADANPGILVDQECDVPPGGNSVRSFLDVVTADTTDVSRVSAALEAFEASLARAPLPHVETIDRVAVRFNAERALEPERIDEYRRLKARVTLLLERWLDRDAKKVASSGG